MAQERRPTSAATALLVALPIGLFLAWTLPARGPSRAELAQALSRDGEAVRAGDLRDLQCRDAAGRYACTWTQRADGRWEARAGRVHALADGWRLAEREGR